MIDTHSRLPRVESKLPEVCGQLRRAVEQQAPILVHASKACPEVGHDLHTEFPARVLDLQPLTPHWIIDKARPINETTHKRNEAMKEHDHA
jgi:hypothetical protein